MDSFVRSSETSQKGSPRDRYEWNHIRPVVDKVSQQGWMFAGSDYDAEEDEEEDEDQDEGEQGGDEGEDDGGEDQGGEDAGWDGGEGGDGDIPDGGFEE